MGNAIPKLVPNRVKIPQTEKQLATSLENLKLAHGESQLKRWDGANAKLEGGLKNDFDPRYELKQERTYHRTFINMAAAGYTAQEISEFTGFTRVTVANALRQPWAREHLIKETKKTLQDEMKEFLEGEILPSLRTLVAVRDGDQVKPSDKVNASNALLDRFLGKPVQPITEEIKPPSEMSDEELRKQVERELSIAQRS